MKKMTTDSMKKVSGGWRWKCGCGKTFGWWQFMSYIRHCNNHIDR